MNPFFPNAVATYADLLNAARDASPFFDPTRIPGGVAARLASQSQRALIEATIRRDPDMFRVTTTVPAVSLVPGTPYTLPPFTQVIRLEVQFTAPEPFPEPLPFIPASRADDYASRRGAYLTGTSLNFTGRPEDWGTIAGVVVCYVPQIADFAAESDSLSVPDDAKDAVAADLALRFARRVNGMPIDGEDPEHGVIQLDMDAFTMHAATAVDGWFQRVVMGVRSRRVQNRNMFA